MGAVAAPAAIVRQVKGKYGHKHSARGPVEARTHFGDIQFL